MKRPELYHKHANVRVGWLKDLQGFPPQSLVICADGCLLQLCGKLFYVLHGWVDTLKISRWKVYHRQIDDFRCCNCFPAAKWPFHRSWLEWCLIQGQGLAFIQHVNIWVVGRVLKKINRQLEIVEAIEFRCSVGCEAFDNGWGQVGNVRAECKWNKASSVKSMQHLSCKERECLESGF